MTDTPHDKDCIALEEPEPIDHLSQLTIGDRVLIDGRRRPLTVIAVGVREMGDDRVGDDGAELETPLVRLQGHWPGAKTIELAHKIKRAAVVDDELVPALEELSEIVDRDLGRPKDVRRTHIAGSRSRAEPANCEAAA